MSLSTESIVGYQVAVASASELAQTIGDWIDSGARACRWLACLNPHSFAVSQTQPSFADALSEADWLVPDGVGIVLASWFLGGSIRHRVTGSDIFHAVNTYAQRRHRRVFLLGSTNATLAEIEARLAKDWPGLVVVGAYSPPFRPEFTPADNRAMVDAINAAQADILWVGLTAPKQEVWLHRHRAQLNVPFAAGIGAVFDFYTGKIKRSSPTMQRLGLEWLPRLLQEPRRLWRRTFVSGPIFASALLREKVGGANTRGRGGNG